MKLLLLLIGLLMRGGRKWKNLKFLMAEMNPTSLGFVTIQMDMFSIAVAAHLRAISFSTARSVAGFKITTTWRGRAVLLAANTSRFAPKPSQSFKSMRAQKVDARMALSAASAIHAALKACPHAAYSSKSRFLTDPYSTYSACGPAARS